LPTLSSLEPINLLTTSRLDIIPLPSIGLRSSTSIFSTPTAIEAGRQGLESLNRELAEDPSNTSERLQKSLNDLKELLKPEGIAQL
jgi:cohesin loading factor subunit SCC2